MFPLTDKRDASVFKKTFVTSMLPLADTEEMMALAEERFNIPTTLEDAEIVLQILRTNEADRSTEALKDFSHVVALSIVPDIERLTDRVFPVSLAN